MTYLDDDAALIRAALTGEAAPPDNSEALFRLYAVLLRVCGEQVGLADVHDAWSAWMAMEDPAHPAIVPFAELPPDKQEQDRPYVDAIRAVARRHRP